MKNKYNVKAYCQTELIPNSLLPKATYVLMVFGSLLHKQNYPFPLYVKFNKVMLPKPPMSVLHLDMGCSASNDYMILMPYYHIEITYIILDMYSELILLNNKSQT